MNLKSIRIENFQSHKDTFLEFSEGVNTIVGLSCSGKSAILRALNFVFNNLPSGDIFMSDWGGDTSVSVDFGDCVVTRIKGKSTNKYILSQQGKEDRVFQGFNKSVPDAIKEQLNIHDFNMRFQHQGAFLLSDAPGEISRYLNQVARMDSIDKAISNIESTSREERQAEKSEALTFSRLSEDIKKYDFVEAADEDLIKIEDKQKVIEEKTKLYNFLIDIIEEIERINSKIKDSQKIINLKNSVESLLRGLSNVEEGKVRADSLFSLCDEIRATNDRINSASLLVGFKNSIESLLNRVLDVEDKRVTADSLSSLCDEIKAANEGSRKASLLVSFKDSVNKCLIKMESIKNNRFLSDSLSSLALETKRLHQDIISSMSNISCLKDDFNNLFPDICPLQGERCPLQKRKENK